MHFHTFNIFQHFLPGVKQYLTEMNKSVAVCSEQSSLKHALESKTANTKQSSAHVWMEAALFMYIKEPLSFEVN